MKTIEYLRVLTVVSLVAAAAPAVAQDTVAELPTFQEAMTSGEFHLNLRYRFESVDQDNVSKDANASTLRTSMKYTTLTWNHLSLGVEAENISEIGFDDEFNNKGSGSLWNRVTDRPVVADPELTELNQAFLGIDLAGDTKIKLGRIEVGLADQRFLGPVGWRQNHQSLDGAYLNSKFGTKNFGLSYVYLDRVHRIFGDSEPMASHALELQWTTGFGKLGAFLYELDYDDLAGLSTNTVGVRWSTNHTFDSSWKLGGGLQVADQSDTGNNPQSVDAGYLQAEISLSHSAWTTKLALEVLEGEPAKGKFTTPLATLHKFNGWADKFLGTPTYGLRDTYVEVGWKGKDWSAKGVYHDFEADTGSASYGSELDLVVSYKTPWKQQFLFKAANYDADEHSVDTQKIWLQTVWGF